MPTPLPSKGAVLQTAEFADSLYSPVLVAFVSCVSPTFFQPVGSGSHLYSANRNTLRSGHGVEVLLTLVGLSLWDCLTLAFCTLIVSHFKEFVKRFFELFSFGREILFYFTQLRIGERLFAPVCLFTSLLYHTLRNLSRGFFNFFLFLWVMIPLKSVEKVGQSSRSHPWGPSVSHFAGY